MLLEVILDGRNCFEAAAAKFWAGHLGFDFQYAKLDEPNSDMVNAQLLVGHIPMLPFAKGAHSRFRDVLHSLTSHFLGSQQVGTIPPHGKRLLRRATNHPHRY